MSKRALFLLALALAAVPALEAPAQIDNGTAVEGCIGCHSAGTALPIGNVGSVRDGHYVDPHPAGPRAASGSAAPGPSKRFPSVPVMIACGGVG